jgi:bifunctional non-homologous end joining protein LigD
MSTLDTYRNKRDFSVTPEPEAQLVDAGGERPAFVVQKHDATRLHYDFRLEHGGVLWSWAVTRGPSLDPAEKRLAVRTEDHPLAYGDFEGTIPEGEYGGGTVMLWDKGWWEPLHDPVGGLEEGKLHFLLHGSRMKGGWALVRMRPRKGEKRENWLLIKQRDRFAGRSADALLNRYKTSVVTGRTMRSIATDKPEASKGAAQRGRMPRFRAVQLATLKDTPPEGEDWRHEAKFDGYRCLIAIGEGGVRFYTRNGKDWSDRFGSLSKPAAAIPCDAALIDGEVIAGPGGGDFSTLQTALQNGEVLVFYAFDLLHLDGEDLTGKPQSDRRASLERLLAGVPPRGPIRLSPFVEGSGAAALARICREGGEGIVSKRADAPYRGGRGTTWIKAKCTRRAEFVIAGWSPSDKRGRPFSSLLLGSYERGRLVYRGRVGTGFDAGRFETLVAAMKPLARKSSPFDEDLPAETRHAHWLTPKLVAEVIYAEFTAEGRIRHGVYRGLREDKEATDVSAASEAETHSEAAVVGGVRISSARREIYPGTGITKGDVATYYEAVAGRFLETAAGRPVSLLRCPSGIDGERFFQKHAGKGFPDAIATVPIREKDGSTEDYMVLLSRQAVLGAVQMGTVEFHIWGATRDDLERPDRMVFDLDPDEGYDFGGLVGAAQEIRRHLAEIGLDAGAMVTGGKGIHVIVPLRRAAGWDTVKTFAQTFATVLAEREPGRFTATMAKAKRKDRIFIDWLRNERGATAIAPYSLRARKGAPVAVPVDWDELESLRSANGFSLAEARQRARAPCPLAKVEPRRIGRSIVEALEVWAKG